MHVNVCTADNWKTKLYWTNLYKTLIPVNYILISNGNNTVIQV